VKFLVDRCAGRRLAEWLRGQGHDVLESREQGDDPGDDAILQRAASENRILVTMDKDFGALVFEEQKAHSGLVRLPDVPAERRIELMAALLQEHSDGSYRAQSLPCGAAVCGSRRGGRSLEQRDVLFKEPIA
jgi:predicted nuclease of predicted toxin-antitoxin system